MRKHTDVDILAELKKLVDAHVRHYKEDFEVDRKFITQTAKDVLPEDRTLIWFCREYGTHCFREAQTFIRDTREHNTLCFYAEQSGEDITARIVVPKQLKGKRSWAMCMRSASRNWLSRSRRTLLNRSQA